MGDGLLRSPDISLLGWVRNLIGFYEARELVDFDSFGNVGRLA
jgi:GST-like protein